MSCCPEIFYSYGICDKNSSFDYCSYSPSVQNKSEIYVPFLWFIETGSSEIIIHEPVIAVAEDQTMVLQYENDKASRYNFSSR